MTDLKSCKGAQAHEGLGSSTLAQQNVGATALHTKGKRGAGYYQPPASAQSALVAHTLPHVLSVPDSRAAVWPSIGGSVDVENEARPESAKNVMLLKTASLEQPLPLRCAVPLDASALRLKEEVVRVIQRVEGVTQRARDLLAELQTPKAMTARTVDVDRLEPIKLAPMVTQPVATTVATAVAGVRRVLTPIQMGRVVLEQPTGSRKSRLCGRRSWPVKGAPSSSAIAQSRVRMNGVEFAGLAPPPIMGTTASEIVCGASHV
jgi:hypothetical protein